MPLSLADYGVTDIFASGHFSPEERDTVLGSLHLFIPSSDPDAPPNYLFRALAARVAAHELANWHRWLQEKPFNNKPDHPALKVYEERYNEMKGIVKEAKEEYQKIRAKAEKLERELERDEETKDAAKREAAQRESDQMRMTEKETGQEMEQERASEHISDKADFKNMAAGLAKGFASGLDSGTPEAQGRMADVQETPQPEQEGDKEEDDQHHCHHHDCHHSHQLNMTPTTTTDSSPDTSHDEGLARRLARAFAAGLDDDPDPSPKGVDASQLPVRNESSHNDIHSHTQDETHFALAAQTPTTSFDFETPSPLESYQDQYLAFQTHLEFGVNLSAIDRIHEKDKAEMRQFVMEERERAEREGWEFSGGKGVDGDDEGGKDDGKCDKDENGDKDGDASDGHGLKNRKVDADERIGGDGVIREGGHESKQDTGRQGGPRKIIAMRARRLSMAAVEKAQED